VQGPRRARKKDATRQALRDCALRLVQERGLGAVTVEDITDAADVSERTFFNYFACKEDAIVGPSRELGEQVAHALASRPAHESTLAALAAVVLDVVRDLERSPERRADWAARMQLARQYPATVLPRQLAAFGELEQAIVEGVAARTGTDPSSDLYPRLLAAVAVCATRTAMALWRSGEPGTSLVDLVDRAFSMVAGGLGDPGATCRQAPQGGPLQ